LPILHPDPPRIPPHRTSAREVLASFRGLPPEAHLFVHLGIPSGPGAAAEELDFLVVHPELGLVIVQVPDPGEEPPGEPGIEPWPQGPALAHSHYLLQDFLKKAGAPELPPITRVIALPALPLKPGQALGPDLPAWRILTRDKLRQPLAALREAVAGGRPWTSWRALDQGAHPPLAAEPFRLLLELLTPVLLPQPPLAELMAAEGAVPDPEAQLLLDHLADNFSQGRYRLRGAPGSGKSLLGRKVARLWAAEGRQVLVLTPGRALALATRTALADLVEGHQAAAATCEELALALLEDARALRPDLDPAGLPAALARALPALRQRWDALVLDEAQELAPAWIAPLLGLLRDPDRDPVLVLEDPARSAAPGQALPGQRWRLELSLRHGAAIRRAALEALPGSGWTLPRDPVPAEAGAAVVSRASAAGTWRRDLGEALAELQAEGLEPAQILVLAGPGIPPAGIDDGEPVGPWPVAAAPDGWQGGPAAVRFGTVQAFQGLEAEAVVYLAPDFPHPDAARQRYAALSRARRRAIVLDRALAGPAPDERSPWPPPPIQDLEAAASATLLAALRS
jgi:hypothetical protein